MWTRVAVVVVLLASLVQAPPLALRPCLHRPHPHPHCMGSNGAVSSGMMVYPGYSFYPPAPSSGSYAPSYWYTPTSGTTDDISTMDWSSSSVSSSSNQNSVVETTAESTQSTSGAESSPPQNSEIPPADEKDHSTSSETSSSPETNGAQEDPSPSEGLPSASGFSNPGESLANPTEPPANGNDDIDAAADNSTDSAASKSKRSEADQSQSTMLYVLPVLLIVVIAVAVGAIWKCMGDKKKREEEAQANADRNEGAGTYAPVQPPIRSRPTSKSMAAQLSEIPRDLPTTIDQVPAFMIRTPESPLSSPMASLLPHADLHTPIRSEVSGASLGWKSRASSSRFTPPSLAPLAIDIFDAAKLQSDMDSAILSDGKPLPHDPTTFSVAKTSVNSTRSGLPTPLEVLPFLKLSSNETVSPRKSSPTSVKSSRLQSTSPNHVRAKSPVKEIIIAPELAGSLVAASLVAASVLAKNAEESHSHSSEIEGAAQEVNGGSPILATDPDMTLEQPDTTVKRQESQETLLPNAIEEVGHVVKNVSPGRSDTSAGALTKDVDALVHAEKISDTKSVNLSELPGLTFPKTDSGDSLYEVVSGEVSSAPILLAPLPEEEPLLKSMSSLLSVSEGAKIAALPHKLPPPTSHVVLYPYTASALTGDELNLQVGDLIGIEQEFDDGWGLGQNITRSRERGFFPMNVVTAIKSGPSQNVDMRDHHWLQKKASREAISGSMWTDVNERRSSLSVDTTTPTEGSKSPKVTISAVADDKNSQSFKPMIDQTPFLSKMALPIAGLAATGAAVFAAATSLIKEENDQYPKTGAASPSRDGQNSSLDSEDMYVDAVSELGSNVAVVSSARAPRVAVAPNDYILPSVIALAAPLTFEEAIPESVSAVEPAASIEPQVEAEEQRIEPAVLEVESPAAHSSSDIPVVSALPELCESPPAIEDIAAVPVQENSDNIPKDSPDDSVDFQVATAEETDVNTLTQIAEPSVNEEVTSKQDPILVEPSTAVIMNQQEDMQPEEVKVANTEVDVVGTEDPVKEMNPSTAMEKSLTLDHAIPDVSTDLVEQAADDKLPIENSSVETDGAVVDAHSHPGASTEHVSEVTPGPANEHLAESTDISTRMSSDGVKVPEVAASVESEEAKADPPKDLAVDSQPVVDEVSVDSPAHKILVLGVQPKLSDLPFITEDLHSTEKEIILPEIPASTVDEEVIPSMVEKTEEAITVIAVPLSVEEISDIKKMETTENEAANDIPAQISATDKADDAMTPEEQDPTSTEGLLEPSVNIEDSSTNNEAPNSIPEESIVKEHISITAEVEESALIEPEMVVVEDNVESRASQVVDEAIQVDTTSITDPILESNVESVEPESTDGIPEEIALIQEDVAPSEASNLAETSAVVNEILEDAEVEESATVIQDVNADQELVMAPKEEEGLTFAIDPTENGVLLESQPEETRDQVEPTTDLDANDASFDEMIVPVEILDSVAPADPEVGHGDNIVVPLADNVPETDDAINSTNVSPDPGLNGDVMASDELTPVPEALVISKEIEGDLDLKEEQVSTLQTDVSDDTDVVAPLIIEAKQQISTESEDKFHNIAMSEVQIEDNEEVTSSVALESDPVLESMEQSIELQATATEVIIEPDAQVSGESEVTLEEPSLEKEAQSPRKIATESDVASQLEEVLSVKDIIEEGSDTSEPGVAKFADAVESVEAPEFKSHEFSVKSPMNTDSDLSVHEKVTESLTKVAADEALSKIESTEYMESPESPSEIKVEVEDLADSTIDVAVPEEVNVAVFDVNESNDKAGDVTTPSITLSESEPDPSSSEPTLESLKDIPTDTPVDGAINAVLETSETLIELKAIEEVVPSEPSKAVESAQESAKSEEPVDVTHTELEHSSISKRISDSLVSAARVLERIEGASEQLISDAVGNMKDAVSHGLEALHITHQTDQQNASTGALTTEYDEQRKSSAALELTTGESLEKMEEASEQLTTDASDSAEESKLVDDAFVTPQVKEELVSEDKVEVIVDNSLATAVRVLEKIEGASEQLISDALGNMKDAVSHSLEALHITHQTEQHGTPNEPLSIENEVEPDSVTVHEVTAEDSLEKNVDASEQLTADASGRMEEPAASQDESPVIEVSEPVHAATDLAGESELVDDAVAEPIVDEKLAPKAIAEHNNESSLVSAVRVLEKIEDASEQLTADASGRMEEPAASQDESPVIEVSEPVHAATDLAGESELVDDAVAEPIVDEKLAPKAIAEHNNESSLVSAVRVLEKIEDASEQLISSAIGNLKKAVSRGLETLHITSHTVNAGDGHKEVEEGEKKPTFAADIEKTIGDSEKSIVLENTSLDDENPPISSSQSLEFSASADFLTPAQIEASIDVEELGAFMSTSEAKVETDAQASSGVDVADNFAPSVTLMDIAESVVAAPSVDTLVAPVSNAENAKVEIAPDAAADSTVSPGDVDDDDEFFNANEDSDKVFLSLDNSMDASSSRGDLSLSEDFVDAVEDADFDSSVELVSQLTVLPEDIVPVEQTSESVNALKLASPSQYFEAQDTRIIGSSSESTEISGLAALSERTPDVSSEIPVDSSGPESISEYVASDKVENPIASPVAQTSEIVDQDVIELAVDKSMTEEISQVDKADKAESQSDDHVIEMSVPGAVELPITRVTELTAEETTSDAEMNPTGVTLPEVSESVAKEVVVPDAVEFMVEDTVTEAIAQEDVTEKAESPSSSSSSEDFVAGLSDTNAEELLSEAVALPVDAITGTEVTQSIPEEIVSDVVVPENAKSVAEDVVLEAVALPVDAITVTEVTQSIPEEIVSDVVVPENAKSVAEDVVLEAVALPVDAITVTEVTQSIPEEIVSDVVVPENTESVAEDVVLDATTVTNVTESIPESDVVVPENTESVAEDVVLDATTVTNVTESIPEEIVSDVVVPENTESVAEDVVLEAVALPVDAITVTEVTQSIPEEIVSDVVVPENAKSVAEDVVLEAVALPVDAITVTEVTQSIPEEIVSDVVVPENTESVAEDVVLDATTVTNVTESIPESDVVVPENTESVAEDVVLDATTVTNVTESIPEEIVSDVVVPENTESVAEDVVSEAVALPVDAITVTEASKSIPEEIASDVLVPENAESAVEALTSEAAEFPLETHVSETTKVTPTVLADATLVRLQVESSPSKAAESRAVDSISEVTDDDLQIPSASSEERSPLASSPPVANSPPAVTPSSETKVGSRIKDLMMKFQPKEQSQAQIFKKEVVAANGMRTPTTAVLPVQRTVALIKPDVYSAVNLDCIQRRIKFEGFRVLKEKEVQLTLEQAKEFYKEHEGKPFYERLTSWMSSAPIYALELEKEGGISAWRTVAGPTNSIKAREIAPSSLRALLGTDGSCNAVHGSDSPESAEREVAIIFGN